MPEQLGKTVQGRRAEGQIHVRIFVLDILAAVLLRHHAAANGNDQRGLFSLEMLILPHDGQSLLLGVLTDGTGVDRDQIGVRRVVTKLIAHILGHTRKLFAVGHVLLAAKGQHKALGRSARLGCKRGRIAPQLFYILTCVIGNLLTHFLFLSSIIIVSQFIIILHKSTYCQGFCKIASQNVAVNLSLAPKSMAVVYRLSSSK